MKLQRVAKIESKFSSHYVDKNLQPNTLYHYKMSSYTKDGKESEPSEAVSVKTLPPLESVPYFQAIVGLPNMVKLIWRPHPNLKVDKYIIERKDLDSTDWKEIATIEGRLNAEYIDKGLENNRLYRYRIKVKTYDDLTSQPSQVVEAKTKSLPRIVTGLRATTNLPRKITIAWQPNPEPDISYYKVYRSSAPRLFYSYLAKTNDTTFTDMIADDGVARYYKITAVDKDGLESPKQGAPIQGITLDKPSTPTIITAKVINGEVQLKWIATDERAVKFNVLKSYGMAKKQKYTNIKGFTFIDKDVEPGEEYKYFVSAVDKYSIESEKTTEVILEIPKQNN